MNVYVVSFDESEDATDPLLRVFGSRVQMEHAVRLMAAATNYFPVIELALDDGDFTLSLCDDDGEDRLTIHVRLVNVEEAGVIMAKGRL